MLHAVLCDMRRYVLESIGIVFFSVLLALFTNHVRSKGIPLIRPSTSPVSSLSQNGNEEHMVSLQTLMEKLEQAGVLILDARSPEDYGEGHLPGAKNIPYSDLLEESVSILQEIPFDMEIITYCEGIQCSSAEDLAFFLEEMGYNKVMVFLGGWEEWIESGMPVEKEWG